MRALSDATAAMLKPIRLSPHDRLEVYVEADLRAFLVHPITDRPGWVPSAGARQTFIDRCPERKRLEHPANHWKIAATDYTAEIIKACWPESQIDWKDDKAEVVYRMLLANTERQDLNAEIYARFKADGTLPSDVHSVVMHPDLPLTPFQKVACYIALRSEGYAHFMEPGCGKTATVIAEICNLALRRTVEMPLKCLIIPPKNVRINWLREFERFATVCGKVEVVRGDSIDRISTIIQTLVPEPGCLYNVCIMSYDSVVRSIDQLTTISWDYVAADESHLFQNISTQRAKALHRLRDCSRRRRILTGTPVNNTPLDLYAQLEFLGDGYSGFKSWKNFKKFYGVFADVHGDGHEKLVSIQNKPFMKERLARLSFIQTLKDAVPDLPDRVFDYIEVEMTPEQQEVYETVARDSMLKIESMMGASGSNKLMTINSALTILLRLAQVTAGFVTWDAEFDLQSMQEVAPKSIEWFKDDPKLEQLVDVLKVKHGKQKTLVWSCFVPCINRISQRLSDEGLQHVTFYGATSDERRVEAERRFNYDDNCRIFIGNPAAGGTGLNLLGYPPHSQAATHDTNADHSIFYAVDWSYTKRSQAGARNFRKGTRVHVRETDLVVPNTIDSEIRKRVLEKRTTAMDIADIREILGTVLRGVAA